MPKIKFLANKSYSNSQSESAPSPSSKGLPSWYRDYSRVDDRGYHTWKACPALYDNLTSGYFLYTPCDIEFFINDHGIIDAKVLDKRYIDFIQKRGPIDGFISPVGHYPNQFSWYPDWSATVPKGYSISYTSPSNRFDLPFISMSGVVDNDQINTPSPIPFFIQKDWVGVLPSGTPFMQLHPFKREDWQSELVEQTNEEIYFRNNANSEKFSKPGGGVYYRDVRDKRKYK